MSLLVGLTALEFFVAFLQAELDRVGPDDAARAQDFFQRAVDLELAFFDAAYAERTA